MGDLQGVMEGGIFVNLGPVGQIKAIGISYDPDAGGPRAERVQSWAFAAPKREQIEPVYFPNGEQTLIFVACCDKNSSVPCIVDGKQVLISPDKLY